VFDPIIHPALRMLMRLRIRAGVRLMFRGLRTPKGALYALVMSAMLVLWLGPALLAGVTSPARSPDFLRTVVPPGMLAMLILNLLAIRPGSGIAFRPAEVDFLFPAPVLRRDLLVFKLAELLGGSLAMSLLFSVVMLPFVAFWAAGFLGAFLAMSFLLLFPLCLSLLAASVTERAYTTGRKCVLVGVVTAIGAAVFVTLSTGGDDAADALTLLNRWRDSWIGFLVLAPLEIFGQTIGAARWFPDLLGWGSAALAMNVALVLLVLRLDADFMEASAETARKMYERLEQMRQGTVWWSTGWKSASRIRLPAPPWLGGAGPIAWRQLLTALRGIHGWLLIVLIIGLAGTLPLMLTGGMQRMAAPCCWPWEGCACSTCRCSSRSTSAATSTGLNCSRPSRSPGRRSCWANCWLRWSSPR
jgi:hypothetical protein